MKLEIASHHVTNVEFGERTEMREGTLFIDRAELVSRLREDRTFSDIDVAIVHPGEMTRVINLLDVVDIRKKEGGGGEVFPGFTGRVAPEGMEGMGRTHVATGVSIIETGRGEGFFGGVLDMGGEGSRYSPYALTHNVVLVPACSEGVLAAHYAHSLKLAALKTSVYLGKAMLRAAPDDVRLIDLEAGGRTGRGGALPRVGYIWQVLSHYDLRSVYYCGSRSYSFYPFVVHPAEIVDGALVSGHYDHSPALKNYTCSILNNPVLMDLLARHGKDLDFAGVILTNSPATVEEKKRNGAMNARLARSLLRCDGVVITKEGGGHTDMDLMETCKGCEKAGIGTSLIDIEMLSPAGEGDYPLVVFEAEADAIASSGNVEERLRLSAVDKVVGGEGMRELGAETGGEKEVPFFLLSGALSELGMSRIKGEWY